MRKPSFAAIDKSMRGLCARLTFGKLHIEKLFARAASVTTALLIAIVILLYGKSLPADDPGFETARYPIMQPVPAPGEWQGYSETFDQSRFKLIMQEQFEDWSIDYRVRSLQNSFTSYEFGVPPGWYPEDWHPLSRLDFPLDSMWHGLEVGLEKPTWAARVEWMTHMEQGLEGDMEDYDWQVPNADFTDLGITKQRWNDGQMLDFSVEIRLWENIFGLPIEFWPAGGFRWQRFNITCYDGLQYKINGEWLPEPEFYAGDVITFNQQYYVCYLGGQFRTTLDLPLIPPIFLKFQGDIGNAQGYNVDHHLIREGDRYTMESTHGDSWHIALTAEMPVRNNLSVGFEADHIQIRTHGKHRWLNEPFGTDETWDYGVRNKSDQTWLTAFIRLRV
jgi:hypothetical protein